MPKTLRTGRKIATAKRRYKMLGKHTKVIRKNGSRRRIRMIKGGAVWIANLNDLSHVWSSLFYERAKEPLNTKIVDKPAYFSPAATTPQRKALFVIDMQLDFIDRPYTREQGDVHPVFRDPNTIGNFAVAHGATMVAPLTTFIKQCLASKEYTHVIFSRDYHPAGHKSFNKNVYFEKMLCGPCELTDDKCGIDDGGVFPAHCVQGFKGSRFMPEIVKMFQELIGTPLLAKTKVVFKGVLKDHDSFTAVDKNTIDSVASNYKSQSCSASCSNISGSYYLKNDNGFVPPNGCAAYMGKFDENLKAEIGGGRLEKVDYDDLLKDVDTIEVCGLAGDYCVRDTVIALSQKFANSEKPKKIVLLNDFTRYAALPFGSIAVVPQHLSEEKYTAPGYKFESPDLAKKLATAKEEAADKDIVDYLLSFDLDKGIFKLMDKSEIAAVSVESLSPAVQHFITPSTEIIEDYKKLGNLTVVMNLKEISHKQ